MEFFRDTVSVKTHSHCDMIDITSQVASVIRQSGIEAGDCIVFCKHTTAAVTINENADPDVVHDVLMTLEQLVPRNRPGYQHGEGNSDAHVKSSMFGPSQQILIEVGSDTPLITNEILKFKVEPEKIYLFDRQTQRAL